MSSLSVENKRLRAKIRLFEDGIASVSRALEDIEQTSRDLAGLLDKNEHHRTLLPALENVKIASATETAPAKPDSICLPKIEEPRSKTFQNSLESKRLLASTGDVAKKVQAYAKCVVDFNFAKASGNSESVLKASHKFAVVPSEVEYDVHKDHMTECWKALLDDQSGTKGFATAFLESQYCKHVDRVLAQFPRDVILSGRASPTERIKAFTAIVLRRWPVEHLENAYGAAIFAVIFYMIRCGQRSDASHFCKQSLLGSGLKSLDFLSPHIESFSSGQLSPSARSQIHAEFNRVLLVNKADPYYVALLKLIGGCDASKPLRGLNSSLIHGAEDWLWIHSMQLDQASFKSAVLALKLDNAMLYGKCLFVAGLLNEGIATLWDSDSSKIDALHMAIVLSHSKRIAIDNSATEGCSQKSANLDLLISAYCGSLLKNFSDPDHQVHYAVLSSSPVKEELLTDAIMECSNYQYWLGNQDQPGALSSLVPKDMRDVIISRAARKGVSMGRLSQAFQLLNLCGKFDEVIGIIVQHLASCLVSNSNNPESFALCKHVMDYYADSMDVQAHIDRSLFQRALILLRLTELRTIMQGEKDYERAMSIIDVIDIVPLNGGALVAASRVKLVSSWKELLFILPDLLNMIMECLEALFKRILLSPINDSGKSATLQAFKEKASCVLTFASLIEPAMPPEVLSRLARIEASMV